MLLHHLKWKPSLWETHVRAIHHVCLTVHKKEYFHITMNANNDIKPFSPCLNNSVPQHRATSSLEDFQPFPVVAGGHGGMLVHIIVISLRENRWSTREWPSPWYAPSSKSDNKLVHLTSPYRPCYLEGYPRESITFLWKGGSFNLLATQ